MQQKSESNFATPRHDENQIYDTPDSHKSKLSKNEGT